jgi:cyclohexyl-isocyanide hydratase
VCTGALLLGAAGRLQRKRATTHHLFLDRLAAYGATAVRERVVDEGQLVTAAGVTSAIDLGLALVRRLEGDDVAEAIAAQMEVPER